MNLRKTMGTLTIAAAAAFVGVATATPATAGSWDHIWYSTDDNPGAIIKIQEYGDVIQLCDSDADGRYARAYIEWESNGSTHSYTINAKGDGNCTTRDHQDYNIPEGVWVDVIVGLNSDYWSIIAFANEQDYLNDH